MADDDLDAALAAALATTPPPIGRFVADLAAEDPDHPAVSCAGDTITRGELEAQANRLARAYEAAGVALGDTVAIVLPNGTEFAAASLAVWKLGANPCPVSYRMPAAERAALVELADAELVVGVDAADHPDRACLPLGYEPDPALSADPHPDRSSPAWRIIGSGGSTGRPKLVAATPLSQPQPAMAAGFRMRSDGVILLPSPLYHGSGFTFLALGLCLGKHVVLMPRFDAVEALDLITRLRVDWVGLVPTMMSRMAKAIDAEPGRFDLSSLDVVFHGAAVCPAWLKERWLQLVEPERLIEVYGATESPLGVMIDGAEWLEHPGSVGKPAFGEVRILGEDGDELPTGEVGEIYLRPPAGMPEVSRTLGDEVRLRDGWRSVGDLGRVDADGYVYISDRRVDMIVSGGANVYPAEVESALLEHPLVASVVVVGLPDEDLGQRVHALVEPGGEVTVDELLAYLSDRLTRYKIPRSIRLVDEPLRDDVDKARRSALRDREAALLAAGGTS